MPRHTVATGHQSVKLAQMDIGRSSRGNKPMQASRGSACEHTRSPTVSVNEPHQKREPGSVQKDKAIEAGVALRDRYAPSQNPVDSVALPSRKTSVRNGVTPSFSPLWSISGVGAARMNETGWDCSRSKRPGESPGIR